MKIYHVASFIHHARLTETMQEDLLNESICQPMTELLAGLAADGWGLDKMTTAVTQSGFIIHTFIMAKEA